MMPSTSICTLFSITKGTRGEEQIFAQTSGQHGANPKKEKRREKERGNLIKNGKENENLNLGMMVKKKKEKIKALPKRKKE